MINVRGLNNDNSQSIYFVCDVIINTINIFIDYWLMHISVTGISTRNKYFNVPKLPNTRDVIKYFVVKTTSQ